MNPALADVCEVAGQDRVSLDPDVLRRLSSDHSLESGETAAAVVRPAGVEHLAEVVRAAHRHGLPLAVRGGGMSYTRAHTPGRPGMVLLDLRDLNRIATVAADDLYVTAEAGCTWEQVFEAVAPDGLRCRSWGPLSGRRATIGGGLSQNGGFFGTARHGSVSESVLGLDVVLADGSMVATGAAAARECVPFVRQSGPDLTGIFLADSGRLGVKARATLALMPMPDIAVAASFVFDDGDGALAAMVEVARLRIASDVFCFDAYCNDAAARLGFAVPANAAFSVHCIVEGDDQIIASRQLDAVRRAVGGRGREIDGALPLAMLADPFGATRPLFGDGAGQAHLPMHAIVPLSRARDAGRALESVLADQDAERRADGVAVWSLAMVVGAALSLEISLVVPVADEAGREERIRRAVAQRRRLASAADHLGAIHFQVGKYYPFAERLSENSLSALTAVVTALEPSGLLNPGALGI